MSSFNSAVPRKQTNHLVSRQATEAGPALARLDDTKLGKIAATKSAINRLCGFSTGENTIAPNRTLDCPKSSGLDMGQDLCMAQANESSQCKQFLPQKGKNCHLQEETCKEEETKGEKNHVQHLNWGSGPGEAVGGMKPPVHTQEGPIGGAQDCSREDNPQPRETCSSENSPRYPSRQRGKRSTSCLGEAVQETSQTPWPDFILHSDDYTDDYTDESVESIESDESSESDEEGESVESGGSFISFEIEEEGGSDESYKTDQLDDSDESDEFDIFEELDGINESDEDSGLHSLQKTTI